MNLVRARVAIYFGLMCGTAAVLTGCPGAMSQDDKDYWAQQLGAGGSGTGGTGGGSSGVGGCDAPTMVFRTATGCAMTNCHDSSVVQSGLDLSVADPFPALVGKTTDQTGVGSACQANTGVIVDPQNPSMSLLYTKISVSPPCGAPMPFPLGPTDNGTAAACVLDWIEANLAAP